MVPSISMKFVLLIGFIGTVLTAPVFGQNLNIDSLFNSAEQSPNDTAALNGILNYSNGISFYNPVKALAIDLRVVDIARKKNYLKTEEDALNSAAEDEHFLGNYAEALKLQFEALQLNRQSKDPAGEAQTLSMIGILYNELSEYRQALVYLKPADSIYQNLSGNFLGSFVLANMGDAYDSLHMADSAWYFIRESYDRFSDSSDPHLRSFVLGHMGTIYAQFGKYDSALFFYNSALVVSKEVGDELNSTMGLRKIADLYTNRGMYDSGIYYARRAFEAAQLIPSKLHMLRSSELLTTLYTKTNKPDSVLRYLLIAVSMKDSLYGPDKYHKLQALLLDEQQHQNLIRQQEQELRNRIKYILLIAALFIILLIAFLQLRANRLKQKANDLLRQQKIQIESTLAELRSTQAQLIQSEKMASLGELTAGIAHEIQNPLNFVNNFSDVNGELIEEMNKEIDKGNLDEVKLIANDITENEKKINHHGKRADAIVKGMLQHSRLGSGSKELTEINVLADEYLNLAYHGLRAREKSFNVTLVTDYDPSVGSINVVPQDIGRVLLNLYNNAFYAVSRKKDRQHEGYEPTVSVSTRKSDTKIEIRVRDNGDGIPQNIKDKIFQPFFTTKPTGQGTGLGLSLSYDIIKAHEGEVKVNAIEGEGAEFVVELPFKKTG